MIGPAELRGLFGEWQFAEGLFAKSHAEGAHRRAADLGHQRHHQAAVHAAAEQRAERYVRDHAQADRLRQLFLQCIERVWLGNPAFLGVINLPILM